MGIRGANAIYLIFLMIWSGLIFTALLPEVKNRLYSRCVWKLNFVICDRFLGIEGAYRFSSGILSFFLFWSLTTINCNKEFAQWLHRDCWILKAFVFTGFNIAAFMVPFAPLLVTTLYYIIFVLALCFISVIFFVGLDMAHAWKMLWMRRATEKMNEPTCYMCTWLFAIHLTTSVLYSIAFDFVLAFFLFNKISDCFYTLFFLSINVAICLVAFALSYVPCLRERHASSQIIFATVLNNTVYITWLALSDPWNEYCNMFGTVFTGSILESSTSFKSLVSLTVSLPILMFVTFRTSAPSYVQSLLTDDINDHDSLFRYTKLHLVYAFAVCFVLMSVTNFYEPIYFVFKPIHRSKKLMRTSVFYFEGYDLPRFVLLCIVSTLLPSMYLISLIIRIVKDCLMRRRIRKSLDNRQDPTVEAQSIFSGDTEEFLYIEVSNSYALKALRKSTNLNRTEESPNRSEDPRYLLLQCFFVRESKLSYWHFPRVISQTYFKGRNGSNACTIIAATIGRFFFRSDVPPQFTGYLDDTWINLFYSAIEEGNSMYDGMIKDLGVLDLSIQEVVEKEGRRLNIKTLSHSLPVSFDSDVETATIFYQLDRFVCRAKKQVIIFTHNRRTSVFLIYDSGTTLYADTHTFGEEGSILIACRVERNWELVGFLREVLGSNDNKLATLTEVVYEDRKKILAN